LIYRSVSTVIIMIKGMKNLIFIFLVLFFLTGCAQQGKRYGDGGFSGFTTLFQPGVDSLVECYRIPAICTAPNGDLIAAIDERVPSCEDLRSNPDINIVIRRSSDNGVSWSNCETIVDYPLGQSASDPSLIVDHQAGIVFLLYNFMDLTREKDVYYFRVIQSTNHGKSWSDPVDITAQITKPEWKYDFKFITSGRGIQTQNGKLLHTLVNLNNGLHVFGSDDHGEQWYLLDTPLTPGDESKIVELANGAWMVNSRTHGTGFRYVHISSDEGKSWISFPDSVLVDPGCNASLLRYSYSEDGTQRNRLLFANAKSKSERINLTIRMSYDDGKSWPVEKTIYPGRAAYASLTLLSGGDIGLFFEKDDYRSCAFVRFSMDWLTDRKETPSIQPLK